ncbi:hypothetical protein SAMN05444671_1058 [Flavobacterium sp. CF108]|uniref:hypothetical protein n=1 Tax=unclassified Flavobacterium TaxID=196869 RepID=UPI0008B0CE16|nr:MULTISPECIES: hypothetical protein [unclassified Flavobacterium]SEP34526.1 hypothetical protein SAMN04487978_0668 [Flavobacterium sp. fv08]SHG64480.1 hypothetical protein SAMN05444671_1058 [Flavobacterium sp. CF108]
MKYSIAFLIFLSVFTSCESHKSKKENTTSESLKSPKETVTAYLAATNHFDFKTAKEFVIPNKGNFMNLETLEKMEKSIPDDQKSRFINKEKDAQYFEKEITDSTARIILSPNQDIAMPIEFNLKKVNEKWLIESVISH